jgi:pyruvate/2-oxoglutarate/acetoin dehydrogenase E1 component
MAKKPFKYAWVEAIAQEMRKNKKLSCIFQLSVPVVTLPTGEVIDLEKEFGGPLTTYRTIAAPIDEDFNVGVGSGAALAGNPMVVEIPFMATLFPVEHIFNEISKLRAMTGGQANFPMVIIVDGAARVEGPAAQHNDTGFEAVYAFFPGVKVVVPSNAYDAKGLMTAALHQPDPVIFCNYTEAGSSAPVDVPDEQFEVPIGKAAIRQEGQDLTLVAWAPATLDAGKAVANLKKAGITIEYIDLRSIKPLDTATLFASVKKTGRLLVVDHSPYTNSFSAHVLSEVAQFVPGAKMRRITFPDAPGPGAREMILWMRPDAPKIEDAVKKMLAM